MSQVTRIKIRPYHHSSGGGGSTSGGPKCHLFSVLIFDKNQETLESLTQRIRDKLGLSQDWGGMLMFEDGGVIDDLSVIMHDDKIEIVSSAQEEGFKGTGKGEEVDDMVMEDTKMTMVSYAIEREKKKDKTPIKLTFAGVFPSKNS
jgi:hypothetical protein